RLPTLAPSSWVARYSPGYPAPDARSVIMGRSLLAGIPGSRRSLLRCLAMADIPMIISVDDHVVEPPDLWTSRLPKKYLDRGPRVERDSAVFHFEGGNFTFEK